MAIANNYRMISMLREKMAGAFWTSSQHHIAGVKYGKHIFFGTNGDHGGCHSSCHAEQNALRALFASLREYSLVDLINDKRDWAIARENPNMLANLSKVPDPEA